METFKAELIGFDYYNESTIAEIKRNLEFLLSTPAGTCPGDRNFGISQEYVGSPAPVAQNQISLEIIDKVAEYEPRVEVINITSEHDENGHLTNTILIGPNDEYEDDEDRDDEESELEEEE